MHDKFLTCKDCPDRVAMPNCHTTCEGYLARCKKNEAVRNARCEYQEQVEFFYDSHIKFIKYSDRQHNRKKRW